MRFALQADADARSDLGARPARGREPEAPLRAQVESVVAAVDPEFRGQPPRAAQEIAQRRVAAKTLDLIDSGQRLGRAQQDRRPYVDADSASHKVPI